MIRVLDTNTMSALMKGHEAVVARLRVLRRGDVLLPQPVIAEISYGLSRLRRSKATTLLEARFRLFAAELPRAEWNDEVSQAFGTIKADLARRGLPLEDFDVAIAAHAVTRDAVLVSGNMKHMGRIRDLELESWLDPD